MANKHVNAVIVGAGAGGGVVAKELSEAGLTVVMLERGQWQTFTDHDDDELRSQRTTVLGNGYGPDDERHFRLLVAADGKTKRVRPSEGGYSNNAGCVGGGTLSYGAMAWRFLEKDFALRSHYAQIAATLKDHTLEDWPVSYQDLEPFYEKAEWEIGVAGDDSQNPFAAPRNKPHPMPPFPLNREGRLVAEAGRALGLHPFPIPMLRNSRPYDGRPQCIHMRSCVGFACPVGAKNGSQNTVIPRALATGLCELRTGCVAAEILLDAKGRARGVRYFDDQDREQTQTADLVVVAASATESARLLLNSKSKLFPNGLGNNHDWVGRNLQGHAYSGAVGLFDKDIYEEAGPGASVAFCDFSHGNEGLIGGAMLCNEFIRLPYLFSNLRPPGAPRWGKAHKDFQRQFYRRNAAVQGPVQEIPVFDSRVALDPSEKDYWGIPVLRLSGRRHEHDLRAGRRMAEKAEMILKQMGAIQTWKKLPGSGMSGGQHQAGTCRMGNDPKTSVTDRTGRIHGVDNVYVADASLHVTNGGFNPVLTIFALSYWVSHHILNQTKGTKLA